MTTVAAEPVAGPSHGQYHVMQMTSQLHLYSSPQLQPAPVILPVSVQRLTYEDDDIVDAFTAAVAAAAANDDDDDDNDDDARADGGGPQTMNRSSLADHNASASANVSDSAPVRSLLLQCCV